MDALDYEQKRVECRERLAKALGHPEVPHFVWGEVDGLVYSAIFGGDDEWTELVSTAKACLVRKYGRPGRTNREISDDVSITLDEYTRARAETNSEVAALFADGHPEVRRFRKAYLGGENIRLTKEQAQEFQDNLPVHILDEMLSLARRLGWRYRWTSFGTWWFLLTGQAPYVRPLRVHYDHVTDEEHYPNMAQITMIAEPWVDAREFGRVYREVQHQVLGSDDNRKKPIRTLEAVRFTARRLREHGEQSWGDIKTHWDQSQADPSRCYSRGGLERAFKRFLGITYRSPVLTPAEPDSLDSRKL